MQVVNNRDGVWTVNYTPNEVGEDYIDIFAGNELVNDGPFKVNIFKIHVANINTGIIDHAVKFDINAGKSDVGQLEIVVKDDRIPSEAILCCSFHLMVYFYLMNLDGIQFKGESAGTLHLKCW
jgi:hypothetical protein